MVDSCTLWRATAPETFLFVSSHFYKWTQLNVPNILAGPLSVPITDSQHLVDLMLK